LQRDQGERAVEHRVVDRTLAEPWARYAAENPGAKIIRALHNLRNIDRSSVDV
jgi:hypothetical protein